MIHVVFRDQRQIVVHHQRQLHDIEAASRDIRRHEHGHAAGFEICKRTGASALSFVAVNHRHPDTFTFEMVGNAIRAPLLVVQGANDVRVKRDHSDRIVEALRARNHDVEYLVFPDEGHTINRTPNMMTYMRAVERFLARTIGGRDGGEVAE